MVKSAAASSGSGAGKARKPASKRRLGRRDTDEQVNTVIKKQVPGITPLQLDGHKVEGLSFREKITKDKKAAREKGQNLGPLYWRATKRLYGIGENEVKLTIKDTNEQLDHDLMKALRQATDPNLGKRSQSALLTWFSQVRAINQRVMCAITKHCLSLKACNGTHAQILLGFMKTIVRLGLSTKFQEETRYLTGAFDEALLGTWNTMRSNDFTLEYWYTVYQDIIGLVLDKTSLWACIEAKGVYSEDLNAAMKKVVEGSLTGAKIFHKAQEFLVASTMSEHIKEEIAKWDALQNITNAVLFSFTDAALIKASNLNSTAALCGKREVQVNYGGLLIPINVSSFPEEMELKKAANLKWRLIGNPQFESLPFDSFLKKYDWAGTIEKEVFKDWNQARTCLKKMYREDGATAEMFEETIDRRYQLLSGIDRSIAVERAVVKALLGDQGERLMQEAILATLPDKGRSVSLAAAGTALKALEVGGLAKFCGERGRQCLAAAAAAIAELSTGSLKTETMTSAWMLKVKDTLKYFCKQFAMFKKKGAAKGERVELVGAEAAEEKLRMLKEMTTNVITYEKLNEVWPWHFLLADASKLELKKITDEVNGKVTYKPKEPKKKALKSKSASSSADLDADVMSLFYNPV